MFAIVCFVGMFGKPSSSGSSIAERILQQACWYRYCRQARCSILQVCRASGRPRKIWLTRHGESEFNRNGQLGGDSPLSASGQEYAKMLPDVVIERSPTVRLFPNLNNQWSVSRPLSESRKSKKGLSFVVKRRARPG